MPDAGLRATPTGRSPVLHRDWLDRCERLITDAWYRYVPPSELKAPQRQPEVRERHNIFDPTKVIDAYVVPSLDPPRCDRPGKGRARGHLQGGPGIGRLRQPWPCR